MDTHICGRAHRKSEREAKLGSVNQQLDSSYESLAAAPFSPDSALYGRDDRALNQSDNRLMAHQQESTSADTFHTGDVFRESAEDVGRKKEEGDEAG